MPKVQTSKSNPKAKGSKASKRHRSAYLIFAQDKRPQIKSENPGISGREIFSELGALWSSADPQTKQRYQKLADAEKDQYKQKYAYLQSSRNQVNQSMEVNSSQ